MQSGNRRNPDIVSSYRTAHSARTRKMKMMSLSAAAWLLVVLLCRIQPSTATEGTGSLAFLTLSSPSTLSSSDEGYRSRIYISNGFKFRSTTVYSVYVSTNGYISMGTTPSSTSPTIPGTSNIVSPYGADIDTTVTGRVRFTTSNSQISRVNSFIRSETGRSFYGTRMMVAEWDGVAKGGGSSSTTSTFQAVLITDGSSSYAVFIYECGGMEWDGATIGWAYSSSIYEKHSVSGVLSSGIGCRYSSSYSAIIYHLNPCPSNMFTCDNGRCEYQSDVCDGNNDCGDNSDERNCAVDCTSYQFTCDNGNCIDDYDECDDYDDCGDNSDENDCVNVGLAVGLSVGLLVGLFFLGSPICIGIIIYCRAVRKRRPTVRVVTTTPASGAGVVTSTTAQTTSFSSAPAAYPTQPSPYPNQPQPVFKDAQFSSGLPPPSYDAAFAYPLSIPPGYPQQPAPVAGYPTQPQPQSGYPTAAPYPTQAYPPPTQDPALLS